MQETSLLVYAVYARKFNWTPAQVDAIPLGIEEWLLPIGSVLDEIQQKRQDEANGH